MTQQDFARQYEKPFVMNVSMERAVYAFPDHLIEAQELCQHFKLPGFQTDKIAVLGMGGSAIGGDLVRAIAEKSAPVPFQIIRNEELPAFVDAKTLVVAVSYSGNTQETLSSWAAALTRTKNVIAVSTGGKLSEMALRHHIPCLEIPGGLMPRAALGYTFVPVLFILKHICGLKEDAVGLSESISILKAMREKLASNSKENQAKRLAQSLHGKIPVIYAPTPLFEPVARRWKGQINENAKQPAFFDVFPEATHNSIVGFTNRLPVHQSLVTIFLRDSEETTEAKKRLDWTRDTLRERGNQVHEIRSQGKTFVSRLLSLCYPADYVSLYLAQENHVDPTPIEVIDKLKNQMQAGKR